MRLTKLLKMDFDRGWAIMSRLFTFCICGAVASLFSRCAMAEIATTTWIGGSSGAALTTANWDNGRPNSTKLIARITNTVTFTEGSSDYWYCGGLKIAAGVTATFRGRFTVPSTSYLDNKEWVADIDAGGKFVSTYLFYGNPYATLVKKGEGTFDAQYFGTDNSTMHCGSIDAQAGLMVASDSSHSARIHVKDFVRVRNGATMRFSYTDAVSKGSAYPALFQVDAGGVVNMNERAQTFAGLKGEGVITNAWAGLTLSCRRSGETFSGKIYGKLIVKPTTNAEAGSYCVIGAADTLANAVLDVKDVDGYPNPIRFASGIGTFYALRFPMGRKFYDVDGNEVTLVRSTASWYVDASRTEEQGEGDGTTPATAFRTLKAAMENPALAEYDVVYALPGFYTNGVMGTGHTRNRVSVPKNVTLESLGGADVTFIVGANATNQVAGAYGCGTGAVRCVTLTTNSRLIGFTLTGGRVNCSSSGSGDYGGAVYASSSSEIVDCVASNNVAGRGGAFEYGKYVRCRAYGNRALANIGDRKSVV